MIKNVDLYIASLGLQASAQVILKAFCAIRMHGKTCQPAQRSMSCWIRSSVRTVQRMIGTLLAKGYIVKRRRGKKLTNVYYIASFLWRLLTAGRHVVTHNVKTTERPTRDRRELRDLFHETFARWLEPSR